MYCSYSLHLLKLYLVIEIKEYIDSLNDTGKCPLSHLQERLLFPPLRILSFVTLLSRIRFTTEWPYNQIPLNQATAITVSPDF